MMVEPKASSLAPVSHGMASRPGVWGELVNFWPTGQTCMENGAQALSAWFTVQPNVVRRNSNVRVRAVRFGSFTAPCSCAQAHQQSVPISTSEAMRELVHVQGGPLAYR